MTLSVTYFGSSGWLIDFGSLRVLVDPWLVGSMSFSPGKWFFEGRLKRDFEAPNRINLLLLTQGLPDHSHPPSLRLLSRSISVVGSASAALVAKKIGFRNVQGLKPGEIMQVKELCIEATSGAAVPKVENGYLLTHPEGSIYLEPHGFFDEKLVGKKVDALITPVLDIKIPIFGSFIKGKTILPELVKALKPKTVLASTIGGDATYTGLLNKLINVDGEIEDIAQSLGDKIVLIDPIPGQNYELKKHLL